MNFDKFGPIEKREEDYKEEPREEFVARMEEEGFRVIYPKDGELQLDIDSEENYEIFLRNFGRFALEVPAVIERETPSKSGYPKRHIVVSTDMQLTDTERIALQAALGSDPMRELCGMLRIFRGVENPSLLLEPKEDQEDGI